MALKYQLLKNVVKEIANENGTPIKLFRIKRLSDGVIGGWIESEKNLSKFGDCFIYGQAIVMGNAKVEDNATISEYATICGNAVVSRNAEIFGRAVVRDNAKVTKSAQVYDRAIIKDRAVIRGKTKIYGHAVVGGRCSVDNYAKVYGNATVIDDVHIFCHAQVFGDAYLQGYHLVYNNAKISEGEPDAEIIRRRHIPNESASIEAEIHFERDFDRVSKAYDEKLKAREEEFEDVC